MKSSAKIRVKVCRFQGESIEHLDLAAALKMLHVASKTAEAVDALQYPPNIFKARFFQDSISFEEGISLVLHV